MGHPSNGGELATYRRGLKFPSADGWAKPGVVYSIAHASVYSYVPVASVYDTPTGAYIIHDPPGLDARQLVAVPADVWLDGHELLAMVMCSSVIAV